MSAPARYRVHRKSTEPEKKRAMAPQRVLGIVLILAGAGLLAFGFGESRIAVGVSAHAATWYVMVGIGMALAGFILAILGIRRGSARR